MIAFALVTARLVSSLHYVSSKSCSFSSCVMVDGNCIVTDKSGVDKIVFGSSLVKMQRAIVLWFVADTKERSEPIES